MAGSPQEKKAMPLWGIAKFREETSKKQRASARRTSFLRVGQTLRNIILFAMQQYGIACVVKVTV
jgi:hypothetical protein